MCSAPQRARRLATGPLDSPRTLPDIRRPTYLEPMNERAAESPSPDPSIALMRAAAQGDQAAWTELYAQHRTLMRTLLHGRIPASLRSRFDTEDVMQSALLALCRHRPALELQD